jgi:Protein of unknown function (DUF2911)
VLLYHNADLYSYAEPTMKHAWSWTVLLSGVLSSSGAAQSPMPFRVPATNPRAIVRQQVAATDIEVTCNRPSMRGRRIFGGLVPYGEVWRTGSDAATRITFSTPVSLDGMLVDSGAYEVFSIPGEREWVVILQRNRSQWGSYSYDKAYDAVRLNGALVSRLGAQ